MQRGTARRVIVYASVVGVIRAEKININTIAHLRSLPSVFDVMIPALDRIRLKRGS